MKRIALLAALILLALTLIACGEGEYGDYSEYSDDYYSNDDYSYDYDEDNAETQQDVDNDDADDLAGEGDWLAQFANYISATYEEEGIPGLAVAVVEGDEIIFAQGYGLRDVDNGLPVTPETLFHIGSTHKSMNAMLVATLIDDGLFGWDTPVYLLYPNFTMSDVNHGNEVTMRHLLSMRAGIPDYTEDDIDEAGAAEQVWGVLANADILAAPGEEFSYSNLSAAVAGYLSVVAYTGGDSNLYDSYAALLQERILDPIGMDTATVYASEAAASENVSYSYAVYGPGDIELTASYDRDGDPLAPSGSLKANVQEMALYISTQLNGGVAPNGNRVVSEDVLAETWQPYLEDYGMGWEIKEVAGVEVIAHTGAYDGFMSVIGFIPAYDVGFVILLNTEDVGEVLLEDAPGVLAELLSE